MKIGVNPEIAYIMEYLSKVSIAVSEWVVISSWFDIYWSEGRRCQWLNDCL